MAANTIQILITAKDMASEVISGVEKKVSNSIPSFEEAASASTKFGLGLLAAGTAGAGFIGYGAKIAGDVEAARQGFVTLLGSTKEADDTIAQIKKDAAATPFELNGLIKANEMLTGVTHNGAQSETILMNVGKALAGMGKGQPELDRIIANLQQIGAVGHASMMDIRQFAFAGIPIFDLLAKETGKTGSALNDMISNGEVTFDMLNDAFAKAGNGAGQFANAFTNQAGTFNQLVSNMHDSFDQFMANIVTKSGVFDILKTAIGGITTFLSNNSDNISNGIAGFFKWIKENGAMVAGVLVGMLAPSILSVAGSIGSMLLTLAPWAIAGAAVALVIQKLVEHFGGLQKVGEKLSTVWRLLTDTFTGGDPTIKANEKSFAGLAKVLSNLQDWWLKLVDNVKKLWEQMKPVVKFIEDAFIKAFKSLWETIQKDLMPALVKLWPVLKIIGEVVLVAIGVAIAAIIAYWYVLIKALEISIKVFSWVVDVISAGVKGIMDFFTTMGKVISDVWNTEWQIATTVWNGIMAVVKFVIDVIIGYYRVMFGIISYIWQWIAALVNMVMNWIWGYIKPVYDKIVAGVQYIHDAFAWMFSLIAAAVGEAFNRIGAKAASIWSWISGVWNYAVGYFSWLGNHISNALGGAFSWVGQVASGIWGNIKSAFTGGMNWVIDHINSMIDKVNSVASKVPGAPTLGHIGRLATGTNFAEAGQYMVGEQGPELVTLPKGAAVTPAWKTRQIQQQQQGGGMTIQLNITHNGNGQFSYTDAVDMAKQISRALKTQGLDLTEMAQLR